MPIGGNIDDEVTAIRLLASGATTAEIGAAMGHTTHNSQKNWGGKLLRMAKGKLAAETTAHMIRIAYRMRLIEPQDGDPPLAPWTDN